MTEKEIYLTEEGLTKLNEELEHLISVRRPEVAEKIQRAKELRSSVSTPEYEEAKDEQGFVEGRILEIDRIIKSAKIIHHEDVNLDFVEVGNEVRVQLQDGSEEHYTIVGSAEANPSEWRISNESPMGQALLGKRVGDDVEVEAPAGLLKLRILEIK
ncbi:MAG: transcription elongation factor GreA [Dehalococcoidia bacterium]|jgi:transcription elongation factor GreA|nr:transcription elongation factor GreA [Dehalococcoidia bacterium]